MDRPNTFDGMMYEYCVRRGWCGSVKDGKPLHVSDFIPDTGPVFAHEFVGWLILAEGFDTNYLSMSEIKSLIAVFVKHMGAEVLDASKLRSGYDGA